MIWVIMFFIVAVVILCWEAHIAPEMWTCHICAVDNIGKDDKCAYCGSKKI